MYWIILRRAEAGLIYLYLANMNFQNSLEEKKIWSHLGGKTG